MSLTGRFSSLALAALLTLGVSGAAMAHAPVAVLPVHHATSLAFSSAHKVVPSLFTNHVSSSTLIHSQLSSLLHLSGAQRAQLNFNKTLTAAGVKFGTSNFPGGVITGGTLTGTGYYNGTIGGSSLYEAGGNGYVTIGSTLPTGGNFLTFQANTIKAIPIVSPSLKVSQTVRAELQRNNDLLFGGVKAGQASFSGPISGGELAGTAYVPVGPGYEAAANVLIAFGKDPLNQIVSPFSVINGAITSGGQIRFANGLVENVSSGSLLFSKVGSTLFPFGSEKIYLPIGSNILNTKGPNSTLVLPGNYLYFLK